MSIFKYKFYLDHQEKRVLWAISAFANRKYLLKQPITDDNYTGSALEKLCYFGAIANMYYFNSIGKDVLLCFGTPMPRENIIAHAWVEVDGKEYHLNQPMHNKKLLQCRKLQTFDIPASMTAAEIVKMFTGKSLNETLGKECVSADGIKFWVNQDDGTYNALTMYNGKLTRLRSSMIVMDGNKILLGEELDEPGVFSLPGGSFEPGETPEDAAKREVREEVKINTKNVIYTGHDYCEEHDELKDWVRDNVPEEYQWYNYYTCLCIGEYDSEYKGTISDIDLDPAMEESSKWYDLADVINDKSFKLEWKQALYDAGYINRRKVESTKLTEDTRTQLTSKSRSADLYKGDISRGKNRFERKKFSKVANQVKSFNQIDMNDFFKKDLLTVNIPVTGETNSYTVSIQMDGVVAEIAKNIKNNNNKLEYRTIIQSLTKIFNTADIRVKCTCDDFKYRYAHQLIINNNSVDDTSKDPGPGRTGMANTSGKGCKHILLCLANMDWIMKVASVINNYIHYAEEHMQAAFLKVIFPKLYGIPASAMVEEDVIDDDKFLDSSKGLIDAINEYGRNRGKFKKGSNKNPIASKQAAQAQKQQDNKEENTNADDKSEKDSDK